MIKIDSKKLRATLQKMNVSEIADRALFRVGADILEDAQEEIPKPPIYTGDLRGSASIAVNSELLLSGGKGLSPDTDTGENTVRIGFNTAYALRLHENDDWEAVDKEKTPGEASKAGPFWLSSKIKKHKQKYIENFSKYLDSEIQAWLTR